MQKPYTSYIPQNISELMDLLGWMVLKSPKFEDDSGYFPGQNIDTEFFALNEGLKAIRKKVGEENYQKLVELSDRMRAHFEADPEDKTEDGIKGRDCIMDMEEIIRASNRRKPKA
ncbi:hypothetical protein [Novosphingobium album (ex Hu et al. 2023)]|uniref:Uncharacterized protein n=1 Tax=Novosphingobium album (ex Hu et al. 2023) TaxID=2930093 RepID=A0ABT0B2G9_9SPHN|nr:hypothetical protein [Novosphingobium album (ex Hu et al. 2023)]MCJ2178994.1 hypothetical protein [Novosphingobium album (ex Hu et al. 2023)]